ncbi:MAG: GDP-mannose 4,6-dehydratase [Candidatus Dojkabacteria bacterium]|nr:GDP-mannose 4,6-dehydratase [Candidatus Dojkabacteria bacterium]
MTNIFITGATGFIGSYLVEHLSQNPDNIIYGLHRSIKYESTFNALKIYEKENVNTILGDVTNTLKIQEIISNNDIDQIYHLAAQPIVQKASLTPISTYNTNVYGTLSILESVRSMSRQLNKEIVTFVMGTDKSYGTSDILPYTEDLPLNGLDIYSSSKACQDIIARTYFHNYNLPIVIARPSNTYGIDFQWSRLIPSLAKSCFKSQNKPLILNKGSFHQIREYTYVKDLVKAIYLLVHNIDETKGNSYNISSECKYTTEDVVHKFLELTNTKKIIDFKEKESTFKEIPEQCLNTNKLKSVIKWSPSYNLESGLKETIEKYKEWFKIN